MIDAIKNAQLAIHIPQNLCPQQRLIVIYLSYLAKRPLQLHGPQANRLLAFQKLSIERSQWFWHLLQVK